MLNSYIQVVVDIIQCGILGTLNDHNYNANGLLSPVSGESLALAVQGIQGAFEKLLRQTGEPRRDQHDHRDPSKVEMGHSQVTMAFNRFQD